MVHPIGRERRSRQLSAGPRVKAGPGQAWKMVYRNQMRTLVVDSSRRAKTLANFGHLRELKRRRYPGRRNRGARLFELSHWRLRLAPPVIVKWWCRDFFELSAAPGLSRQ